MRDRTKAARAVLQSEMYRGARRSPGSAPGAEEVPQRGSGGGAGHPAPRKGPAVPPHFTALALLGLLDLFKGG